MESVKKAWKKVRKRMDKAWKEHGYPVKSDTSQFFQESNRHSLFSHLFSKVAPDSLMLFTNLSY